MRQSPVKVSPARNPPKLDFFDKVAHDSGSVCHQKPAKWHTAAQAATIAGSYRRKGPTVKLKTEVDFKNARHPGKSRATGEPISGPVRFATSEQGLFLSVSPTGSKSWILRTKRDGVRLSRGFGQYPETSFDMAKREAWKFRSELAEGAVPETQIARARAMQTENVFEPFARRYHATLRPQFKNAKHSAQWLSTLETYVFPIIGQKVVHKLTVDDVLKCLTQPKARNGVVAPLWTAVHETATRVRQRIEAVVEAYDGITGLVQRNPATQRRIKQFLKSIPKRIRVKHHASIPHATVAPFMRELAVFRSESARALEFLIHTCTRTNEALGARWREFDLKAGVWTIPAERTKTQVDYRIPLSSPVLAMLKARKQGKPTDFIFRGGNSTDDKVEAFSGSAFLELSKPMRKTWGHFTPHGFRATFRTWASDTKAASFDICEMALGHAIGDDTVAAYQRGDMLEVRRELAEKWSAFLLSANVVPFKRPERVIPRKSAKAARPARMAKAA